MIEILPNIFAIPVPLDAIKPYISGSRHLRYINPKGYSLVALSDPLSKKTKILGTCTKEDIDFDCEPICDVHFQLPKSSTMGRLCNNLRKQKKSYINYFRSALDKAGIDWNVIEKLVIIEKQTTNQ